MALRGRQCGWGGWSEHKLSRAGTWAKPRLCFQGQGWPGLFISLPLPSMEPGPAVLQACWNGGPALILPGEAVGTLVANGREGVANGQARAQPHPCPKGARPERVRAGTGSPCGGRWYWAGVSVILRETGQALRGDQPAPNAPVSASQSQHHISETPQNLEFSSPLPLLAPSQDVLEPIQLQQTFARCVLQRPVHFQSSVMGTKEMQCPKMKVQGHPWPQGASTYLVPVLLPEVFSEAF